MGKKIYYQEANFEVWLTQKRNSKSIKQYLSYVRAFREHFLEKQVVVINKTNDSLDYLLENLALAIAYDKVKTVELLRLYVKLAEKAISSPTVAIINEDKSLNQYLGIFKSYVDFIEEKCSEPKNGRSCWSKMFKPCEHTVLRLLEHKIVLTHDELVDKLVFALATQDRFSYSRPHHVLFPARIYDSLFSRKKFKDAFMVSGVLGKGLDEMRLIISDRGESVPLRAVKSIEIKTDTGEVTVNLQLFTRIAKPTSTVLFEPQIAHDASQLSIDHIEPQEKIMMNRDLQWPEMEAVSKVIEQTAQYQKSNTDINGITKAAKPLIQNLIESGKINKDKLYLELREMAKKMAFEMMDRGQNSAKSNK